MYYLTSLFYLTVISYLSLGINYKQASIDAVFVAWNKATYLSLNRGRAETADNSQKQKYENRIENLKDTYVGKEPGRIDTGSLRYGFLRKLFMDLGKKRRNFYVIEADMSGAKVLSRDFVVYLDSPHEVKVDVYIYGRDGWFKQAEVKDLSCVVVDDFYRNRVKFAQGFNDDDVIVSKFKNNRVKYSEYYLYGTLAAGSGIKEILDTYTSKNFIK
jgi:hypothetical protein